MKWPTNEQCIKNFLSRKGEKITSFTTEEILAMRKSQMSAKEFEKFELQFLGHNTKKYKRPKNVNETGQYFI